MKKAQHDAKFGRFFAELMEQHRFNANTLHKETGVSRQTIARAKEGYVPADFILAKMAPALKSTVANLRSAGVEDSPEDKPISPEAPAVPRPETRLEADIQNLWADVEV